jgi:hypothetical protein
MIVRYVVLKLRGATLHKPVEDTRQMGGDVLLVEGRIERLWKPATPDDRAGLQASPAPHASGTFRADVTRSRHILCSGCRHGLPRAVTRRRVRPWSCPRRKASPVFSRQGAALAWRWLPWIRAWQGVSVSAVVGDRPSRTDALLRDHVAAFRTQRGH